MIVWNQRSTKYGAAPKDAFLNGKWIVGSVGWGRINWDDPPYYARCTLPGIKEHLGRFETEGEAMSRLEAAVAHWMRKATVERETPK